MLKALAGESIFIDQLRSIKVGITDAALKRWHASLSVHADFSWPTVTDSEHMFTRDDADDADDEFEGMHGDEMEISAGAPPAQRRHPTRRHPTRRHPTRRHQTRRHPVCPWARQPLLPSAGLDRGANPNPSPNPNTLPGLDRGVQFCAARHVGLR